MFSHDLKETVSFLHAMQLFRSDFYLRLKIMARSLSQTVLTKWMTLWPRSHELRTPMAAVIGLLDILICDDCLTNEQYATVTQIRKCSTALLRLLNNILDLSKVSYTEKLMMFHQLFLTHEQSMIAFCCHETQDVNKVTNCHYTIGI